ncbi:MAG: metallophosphoesterase family protein [Phycisphaerae bacterium]
MKVALISDVHGNYPALEQCLAKISRMGVERIFFLGDAVGYLPGEVEVLRRLEKEGIVCQQGNHEAMLLQPTPLSQERETEYRLQEARKRLAEAASRLSQWPQQREIEVAGRRFLLVHGSPASPLNGYVYADCNMARLPAPPCDGVFMGHTHRPFVASRPGLLLVNVGSVGLPRDQGNLMSFAVYDSADETCRIFRVEMDIERLPGTLYNVSPIVLDCFKRKAKGAIFGELIA